MKIYWKEKDSEKTLEIIENYNSIYLSEISIIEFRSAIFRKLGKREVPSIQEAKQLIDLFIEDYDSYKFISINSLLLNAASIAIIEYGPEGLRTLDSIQLASILSLSKDVNFLCADKILHQIIAKHSFQSLFDYNK